MKKYKSINRILLAITLLISGAAFSQTECITPYWGDDIVAFEEDSINLWIGTSDSGLIQFNKQSEIKTYYNTTNSNISCNTIMSLLYHNDELIVSTDSNLLRFTGTNFSSINDTIRGLLIENTEGNLVVADGRWNESNILYILNNDSIIQQLNIPGSSTNTDITLDDLGNIWMIKDDFYRFDVVKFDGENFQLFNNSNGLTTSDRFGISITNKDGVIYIANNHGIYKYINDFWELEYHTIIAPYDIVNEGDTLKGRVSALEWDSSGVLFGGSVHGPLIYLMDNSSLWEFVHLDDLPSLITQFYISKYNANLVYAATPDGFLIIDKNCLGLNIFSINDEPIHDEVNVYPNPANNIIEIESIANIKSWKLIDALGKEVKSLKLKVQNSFTLDVSSIDTGLYFLELELEGVKVVKQIVIE
jgi:hypothetical protein